MAVKIAKPTLLSAHVPMIFNGVELGKVKYEKKTPQLRAFISDYLETDSVDVNPPYQRHDAWSRPKQEKFVASLFNKTMAIPPLFLCKKSPRPTHKHWALDGRQRITAIRRFLADQFSVPVFFNYDDAPPDKKRLTWTQMSMRPECAELVDDFKSQELTLVVFEYCSFHDQRKIFTAINNGEPLNFDEQLYCHFYLARKFLDEVFDRIFCDIKDLLTSKVREKKRFANIRTTHELLILCADYDLSGGPDCRNLRKRECQASAKIIHDALEDYGFEYEKPLDDRTLALFPVAKAVPVLRQLCDLLNDVFLANSGLGRPQNESSKQINARNVVDPAAFLFQKISANVTTVSQLATRKDKLVKFLASYYDDKPIQAMNQSTSDLIVMKKKYQSMETWFKKTRLA